MQTQSFLIGPLVKDGLRLDVKPHATPEDSFVVLNNAFQYRGRIRKKLGYTTLGRLSTDGGTTFPGLPVMGLKTQEQFAIGLQNLIAFDTEHAYTWNGTVFNILPSTPNPVTWNGTNYQFFQTTNYAGAFWATNDVPGFHGWSVTNFAAQSDTGTNATVNVTVPGNTAAIGDYVYFINLAGSGADNNLIFARVIAIDVGANPNIITVQATSFPPDINAFTNGNVTGSMMDSTKSIAGQDGIRYYAATSIGNTWVNYNPPIDPNNVLMGALMIFPYRGYLVFLNTFEGNGTASFSNFPNRVRWAQIGTPYYSQPVPTTPNDQTADPLAARDDLFGRGGANDAPTSEAIVGAGFIRDILVVVFERSTWRLRFVNNAQNPFVWERVNAELGSDCTGSTIPFDKGLMSIGTRGIIISDGNDTSRFDEKIPDDIFNIRQYNNGLYRVQGIRTFKTRLCYWTYPSSINPMGIYPDSVLVYNYDSKNWSYFDDCFTCFGYNYGTTIGYTWNDLTQPWQSYADLTWDAGITEFGFETVIAGNQQGYVFNLEQDSGINDVSLSISAITGNLVTSDDHNLKDGDWIKITGITGITFSDGVSMNNRNFKISYVNSNQFILNDFESMGAGDASGASFKYFIAYTPIVPGSVQVNVGALVFTDADTSNGTLTSSGSNSGTINYTTGQLNLTFNPSIGSTPIYIRVTSYSEEQELAPIETTGAYTSGAQIIKISNFDIQTKIFNFFNDDKRARLSQIDFYMDKTDNGQFVCNVFADSSNVIANEPLVENLQSNVVLTSVNPFQIGSGLETIYRLYPNVSAQTIQLQFTMNDNQIAVDSINSADFELLSMMIKMRRGGRLV